MIFVPIVKSECENELISDVAHERIKALLKAYKAGSIKYEDAVEKLLIAHADGIKGQTVDDIYEHAIHFVRANAEKLFFPYADCVGELFGSSFKQIVVTAEPSYVAQAVSEYLGFQMGYSTNYEINEKRYTGALVDTLAYRDSKSNVIKNHNVEYAFGDSAGDIAMLQEAKYAICISPDEELRKHASEYDWPVFDGDSTENIINFIKGTFIN